MNSSERKIIEALRTGVPIREVIELLGAGQIDLEKQFTSLLSQKKKGKSVDTNGFVFFGGFGTGKSHTLEAFAALATAENFVVSRATVSSNLQLGKPKDVLKALIANTQTKQHVEDGLEKLIGDALSIHADFSSLIKWVDSEVADNNMSSIYSGIARALGNTNYASEIFELIISFLRGDAVGAKLRSALQNPSLLNPTEKYRPSETSAFLTRLFLSLGFSGWVVLFDELELIRLLAGPSTRGKSYAELAHWMGYDNMRPQEGLAVVGCMTSGYVVERIHWSPSGSDELNVIPERMMGTSTNASLSDAAEYGMHLLINWDNEKSLQLAPPTSKDLARVQESLRKIYELTYDGAEITPIKIPNTSIDPMRVHIRRWIVSWDLERQGREIELEDNFVSQNYSVEDDGDGEDEDEGRIY